MELKKWSNSLRISLISFRAATDSASLPYASFLNKGKQSAISLPLKDPLTSSDVRRNIEINRSVVSSWFPFEHKLNSYVLYVCCSTRRDYGAMVVLLKDVFPRTFLESRSCNIPYELSCIACRCSL